MKERIAIYSAVGMGIGGIFGMLLGGAFTMMIGVFAGGFLGWFIAAAAEQQDKETPSEK
jgi:hypothetical protein